LTGQTTFGTGGLCFWPNGTGYGFLGRRVDRFALYFPEAHNVQVELWASAGEGKRGRVLVPLLDSQNNIFFNYVLFRCF